MVNTMEYYRPPTQNDPDYVLPTASRPRRRQPSFYERHKNKLIVFLLFYIILFKNFSIGIEYCNNDEGCVEKRYNLFGYLKDFLTEKLENADDLVMSTSSNSFDILKPETKSNKFDEHIFTHDLLIDQDFGHTWGKLVTKTIYPKDIPADYNYVEMTLDVSINGTQYDRLINMYLNDIIVWRSSTIEPLNRQETTSRVTKDITKYLALFKNEDEVELKFQLDNIIAGELDGIFVVNLKIDYYLKNENKYKDKIPQLNSLEKVLLNSLNPYAAPDKLSPLFSVNKANKPPLLHFPIASKQNKPYKLDALNIDSNTQKLAMELFVSGNAGEEFWYSNVLDTYAEKFDEHGYSTLGHGPVRFLNVYLCNNIDTIKIFNSIPIPVVFTGGFAPSLWKPVVSLGCFDLKGIYIDLTPYLQYLIQDEYFLEFEIVSSNTKAYDSSIGDNWLISGNLMEWNSHDLVFKNSIKDLPLVDNYNVSAKDTESSLKQNVTAVSTLSKEFDFEFEDKDYILQVTYENALKSYIGLKNYGLNESSVLAINELKKYTVLDHLTKEVILYGEDKTQYTFDESMATTATLGSEDSRYDTDAVTTFTREVYLKNIAESNYFDILRISASQQGKAYYNMSPSEGNSGSGSSAHSVKIDRYWPIAHKYTRDVVVKGNKVVIDIYTES